MKNSKLKNKSFRVLFCILHLAFLTSALSAQSTNQSYPTAITSNEITGRIAARDLGDARLTSYFYVFGGGQGDVFINVQTSNFNGDVDVFTAGNLKPLTKITIYADAATSETGRVVYLRQPAKLILRIEGRSPNDEAANFRIKFAGSFEPLQAVAENSASEMPEVKSENKTDVRVNSVGTILEIKPKPLPSPKETIAKKEVKPKGRRSTGAPGNNKNTEDNEVASDESQPTKSDVKENTTEEAKNEERKQETAVEKSEVEGEKNNAPVVIVTDNTAKKDETKTDREVSPEETKETSVGKTTETKVENNPENSEAAAVKSKARTKSKKVKEPNPLESIRLIILFKDGTKIERAMSEVIKVGVDKGTLTVIAKDGSIGRYSILDVAKMTIE
jgi:hypothetical protein